MEPVAGNPTLLDDISEDELDSAFSRVVHSEPASPAAPAAADAGRAACERLHGVTGLSDVQRMAEDDLARARALAASGEWFIESQGRPVGPLSTAQMKERWSRGLIGPDTACWGNGLTGWMPIRRIPALAEALAPAPPGEPCLTGKDVEADLQRLRPQEEYRPQASPNLLAMINEELQQIGGSVPQPQSPPLYTGPLVPWLQPPLPPEPAKGSSTAVKVAVYVALAGVGGLVVGSLMSSAFAMQVLRAAFWRTPEAVPAQAAVTPTPPPRVLAAPAAAPGPAPAAPPPAPPPAVEAPPPPPVERSVQPVRKAGPPAAPAKAKRSAALERDEGGEEISAAPRPAVPARSRAVEDDFDREFGSAEAREVSAATPAARKPKTVYLPPLPGQGAARERLGPSDIMEVVVANKAGLVACANAERQRNPGFKGRLTMRWNILASGRTSDVEVATPELAGSELGECVTRLISGWKFPEHREARGAVTFPFAF